MNSEARQQEILDQLTTRGELTIIELSKRFDVSEMTIRRDVNQLATEGLAVRTRGGIALTARGSFEPPFALRARERVEAKQSIAVKVAEQVLDGQTIILDGGTTGLAVAQQLVGRSITVCVLNLRFVEILAADSATRVMVPGGIVRTGEFSVVGAEVEAMLGNFRFDQFIMTASGVGPGGFTEWNLDDAAVKRTALRSAKRTVVAVDSSKFGREAFARLCGPADVDLVVTDQAVDAEERRQFAMAGTELVIA